MRASGRFPFVATLIAILWAFHFSCGETTEANQKKLARANNIFALNLHKTLAAKAAYENVFFSPLSLSTVLSMLYYGVRGESAKELRQTLGYNEANLLEEDVHSSFHQLLLQVSNSTERGFTLKLANAILADSHLYLHPEYRKSMKDLYRSPVASVDFTNDGQSIVESVNKWVNVNTMGMIRQILKDLDPDIVIIMLNAVYFKGKWEKSFNQKETFTADFYNGGLTTSKKVRMMKKKSTRFPYTDSSFYQAVELPYEGEEMSMLVLLPKTNGGLPSLEQNITVAELEEIRRRMSSREIDLYLPKFTFEFQKDLRPELQGLGLHGIFRGGTDDFSGMTSVKDSHKMSVSQVIHKCKVEVNEEGTRAAASTAQLFIKVSVQWNTVFKADHPFLFFIINKVNGLVLFMGRVSKL